MEHPFYSYKLSDSRNDSSVSHLAPHSNKKVWWVCDKGHEWEMSKSQISQIQGNPCPYCAGRKVLPGFNDLATQHPAIAKEWNTKRNSISAEEILWNSHKKVWWVCGKGHEWETAVYLRTQSHTGCPYCAGRKFLPGFNDLATQHPAIAKEWNTKRNGLVNAVGVAYEPNDR